MYTGSSILDLEVGEADLSRRKLEYRMVGLSFCEYLAISYGYHLPVYSLEDILKHKVDFPYVEARPILLYNPQIQISAESETKRSIFREKDKTKRSKKESAQHSKSRNKSFVMTSVSAL